MQEVSIAVRAYIPSKKGQAFESEPANEDLVLVFDSETTTDIYRNLKVGLAQLYYKYKLVEKYAYYWHVTMDEQALIESYYTKLGFKVYHRDDFNEKVFLPIAYTTRAKVVGFNLPFDISRLAISWGQSHKSGGRAFTFSLSENRHLPTLKVEHVDSKMSFIGFVRPWNTFEHKKTAFFNGYFLDLRTAVFALTNEKLDLKTSGKTLGATVIKRESDGHGQRITEEYLGYLQRDVRVTWALYVACENRFKMYGINRALNKIYSPAGIGKAYLEKMGVHEFLEKNLWTNELVGKVMSTFFGARVEARIRKEPVKVTYADFTSLYPTLYILLGADSYIKAKCITPKETTAETQALLNMVNLRMLREKATWRKLWTICKIKLDGDILPIRARFGEENTRNIGLCKVHSDVSLWYALPDLIASKLHGGKTPVIEEAISFVASEPEEGLNPIEVLPDVTVGSSEDFIKTLIENRQKIKGQMKKVADSERAELDIKQYVLKIIANSTSYGVYVQTNTKDLKEQEAVSVYSLFGFKANSKVTEREGELFNPIVGSLITSGAKLFLAISEKIVSAMKGYIAYLDTDGLFAEPRCVKPLQTYFASLNPYGFKEDLLKIEEDKATGKPLENVTMYAISSKRYVLYEHDVKTRTFNIFKYSSHGLGHILFESVDARKQWWTDILNIVYYGEYAAKYNNALALMRYNISSWSIYKQIIKLNESNSEGRPERQIRPFNFLLVGQGSTIDEETKDPIIPMIPFTKNLWSVLDNPFVDKMTGKVYTENVARYYQTIADVFSKYINHPESKFEGNIGPLKRRTVHISKNGIRHIGKESFHLDDSDVFGAQIDDTIEFIPVEERVKEMTLSEAETLGISRSQFFKYKQKLAMGIIIKPNRKTRRALMK